MIVSSASCTTMSLLRAVCDQYFCPASSSSGDKGDSDGDGRKERDEGTSSRHGMIMEVVMEVVVLEVPRGMR